MADAADIAADELSLAHDNRIAQIRRQAAEQRAALPRFCLNCETELAPGCSFCDLDCQQDHEKRQRMKGYAD
jgi:hypothetical protein